MLNRIFPVPFSKLPIPIRIIGIYFLLTPITSFIGTAFFKMYYEPASPELAYQGNIYDLVYLKMVFQSFTISNLVLNLIGFLVGFGILGVKRWGYILFLTFNTILIAFAVYYLAKYGIGLDGALVFNLFVTLIPFFLILYFLNQEISTPYLTLLPRGFRGKWRIEVPISGEVLIEGKKALRLATMDISPSGCLAKVEGTVPDNAHLNIRLDIERKWEVPVQLVRREDNELEGYNLGFKFEYEVNDHRKKELKKYLSTKLLPRFSITTPVEVEFNSKKFSGEVINVSEGGFYLSTKEILNPGDEISFQLKLMGFPFKGTGKVSWENQKEEFNKPAGCGITFTKIESNFLYNLILFFFEKKLSLEYRER